VSKRYQTGRKEGRSFALITVGFLVSVIVLLMPVFAVWGIIWWVDAIGIAVAVVAPGAFALGGLVFFGQWTLKLEVDSAGLRLKNWRESRFLPWSELTALGGFPWLFHRGCCCFFILSNSAMSRSNCLFSGSSFIVVTASIRASLMRPSRRRRFTKR
jgi:hypothetical protein